MPATLTARLLPQDEWGRLAGTELAYLADVTSPVRVWVLVIEEDGQIVGCWARMLTDHVEGLWVAPEHRKRGGVNRLLLDGMRGLLKSDGVTQVLTQSVDPTVDDLLRHIGGEPIPGQTWVFPVQEA